MKKQRFIKPMATAPRRTRVIVGGGCLEKIRFMGRLRFWAVVVLMLILAFGFQVRRWFPELLIPPRSSSTTTGAASTLKGGAR